MKKFFSLGLIATVLAVFTFSSCSKDDDDSIVGKWKLETMKIEGSGVSMSVNVAELGGSDIIEFKSDGTYVSTSVDEDGDTEVVTGTYSVSGSVITAIFSDGDSSKINFSLSGNTLEFYEEGYYDADEDEMYYKQPAGKNFPKVKESMIYKRM
jgi:hypothetical protein